MLSGVTHFNFVTKFFNNFQMRKHLGKLTTEIILSVSLDMKIRKTHTHKEKKAKTLIPLSLIYSQF
jgi:hypothetical protein